MTEKSVSPARKSGITQDLVEMRLIEKTYEDLKFQIPFLDFNSMIKHTAKGMNWETFAEDFIFEPKNPFIRKSIRSVHSAKT